MHSHALNGVFGCIRFGDDRSREAQFGRLFQAILPTRCRAYFARQADFAKWANIVKVSGAKAD